MISATTRAIGVAATAAVLVAASIAPAMAADASPDSVVEQVNDVAPYIGEVIGGSVTDAGVETSGENISLIASSQLGDGIEVTGGEGATSMPVSIGFSEEAAVAEIASDGSIVYSTDSGDDVVVQATSDAVRVQTVIDSGASAHEILFSFADGFVPGSDGVNFFISDIHNPDGATTYAVEQPWAFDAAGSPVETYLEIRGDDLVQVVVPDADTVYPVIADPTFKWVAGGFGAQFTRAETRDIANAAGAGVVCTVFNQKIPVGPHKLAASVACALIAGYIFTQANIAQGNNSCIFVQFVPSPAVWRGCS